MPEAAQARAAMHGRKFGGHVVVGSYLTEEDYAAGRFCRGKGRPEGLQLLRRRGALGIGAAAGRVLVGPRVRNVAALFLGSQAGPLTCCLANRARACEWGRRKKTGGRKRSAKSGSLPGDGARGTRWG